MAQNEIKWESKKGNQNGSKGYNTSVMENTPIQGGKNTTILVKQWH